MIALTIVIVIWIISLGLAVFSGMVYHFEREDWALMVFIICVIIFIGIPLVIVLAIISGVTTTWTQFL